MKPIEFCGDSLDRLREFPREARREVGFQLDRVERGLEPFDWRPIATAQRSGNSGSRRFRRVPGAVCGQIRGRRLRTTLLPKEDSGHVPA